MSKKVSLDEKISRIKRLESLFIDGFRFKKFQDNGKSFSQENVIKSMLKGKDTMAIMPTGAGKSMIFQDAAFCQDEGITLVISPLVALIHDQVKKYNDKFERLLDDEDKYREYCEIAGEKFDGAIPRAIVPGYKGCYAESLFREISSPKLYKEDLGNKDIKVKYTLLYISPERLTRGKFMSAFMSAVKKGIIKVNGIVIDECHCISKWGYDFRPAYLNIIRWINIYERVTGSRIPRACFSATATATDIKIIESTLDIKAADMFISRERNENIRIAIKNIDKGSLDDALIKLIDERMGTYEKAIVFCNNRMKVDDLYNRIKSEFPDEQGVVKYHSGLYQTVRKENAEQFCKPNKEGGAKLMIATEGFSMGIDCADIDLIVHFMPENIESYYQEIGRAGRWPKSANRMANAILLYKQDGIFDAGTMVNVSKWSAALKENTDERSVVMRLEEKHNKLLAVLELYRFACIYDMAIKGIEAKEDCDTVVGKIVKDYFEKSIFDESIVEEVKGKIKELSKVLCSIYDGEIDKREKRVEELKTAYKSNIKELEEKILKIEKMTQEYDKEDEDIEDVVKALETSSDRKIKQLQKEIDRYKTKAKKETKAKEKIASLNSKIKRVNGYKEDIESAPLKAEEILKDCLGDESILSESDDFTKDIKESTKTERLLKVCNTPVAYKLRTDRDIRLGKSYVFTEEEIKRDIPRIVVKEGVLLNVGFDLENFYLSRNILFVYVLSDIRDEKAYIQKQYRKWCEIHKDVADSVELIYAVGLRTDKEKTKNSKRKKTVEKYCITKIFFVTQNSEIERLTDKNKDKAAELLNCNVKVVGRIEEHVGCVVNKIRDRQRKSLKNEFDSLRINKDENSLITLYFEGKRTSEVMFVIDRKDGLESGRRAVSYFDLCVFDAVCTLYASGRKRIFLQSIWRMLCGNQNAEISTKGKTKRLLQESIDRMSELKIMIEDSSLGIFSDDFLKVKKDSKGYLIDEMPVLYQYAEAHNGMITSLLIDNLNAEKYFPVDDRNMNQDNFTWMELSRKSKKRHDSVEEADAENNKKKKSSKDSRLATVENVVLIHYLLYRASIYRHNKLINKINYDSIINTVGSDMTDYHRNSRYARMAAKAVIPYVLKDVLSEDEISEKQNKSGK